MRGELVISAVGGVRVFATPPDAPSVALAEAGVWEWNVGALLLERLRAGDVAVDVGANAGYYTALAAKLVGATGHVYALEPAPEAVAMVRRNLELNDLAARVTVIEAAAGAEEGTAHLTGGRDGHDPSSTLLPRDGGIATTVAVVPLHSVVAPAHRERLRLVKIDVEGYEGRVLDGLDPLLADGHRPTLVVEVHAGYNPGAPAEVTAFCARHALRGRLLLDADPHLAPVDRRLALRDLGAPPVLTTDLTDRYTLVLDAR
jgi:FkbM family methyltransferase